MLERLEELYPVRYTAFVLCVVMSVVTLAAASASLVSLFWPLAFMVLSAVGIHDLLQRRHAILRNYPIIGHFRFALEFIRPEIRQYFLESETEATPFSRAQRSLVYARAKGQSDKRPFGTQLDVQAVGYEWMHHSIAPTHLRAMIFAYRWAVRPACSPMR